MPCAVDVLVRELETYNKSKEGLVSTSRGKYALISDDTVLGVWQTYEDALKAGYESCGIDKPFMVRLVSENEQVHLIYRGSIS